MSEPRQALDELELKKRARRRLVGAVAFATFAAVVLPMVMDETPPPTVQDIDLRIPGQDQVSSSPLTTGKPATPTTTRPVAGAETASHPAATPASTAPAPLPPSSATPTPPPAKPAKVEPAVPAATPSKATSATPVESAKAAPAPKPPADAKRAQAILDGQGAAAAADSGAAHVILIGAFANAANVKNIQTKLGQLGIKTYTENLESPQGRKTRVRAGPFPNRDAADKALDKMKRIGVDGVVAAKS